MRRLPAFLPLFLLSLLPCAALAQGDAAAARRTIAAIEKILAQRPEDATLWFFLSRSQAGAGDKAASIEALKKVDRYGDGFLPPRDGFEAVWDDPAWQAVRSKLEARLPRLDYAPTAFELDDTTLIPEGIAFDIPSRSLFMGSIARKKVLRFEPDNTIGEFAGAAAGLDSVLGLAVDSPRRILYVVSTSALTDAGRKSPRNAVVAFDIDNKRLLQRYDVPGAAQLNDVAVAPGGRVFASDSASGAIHEIAVKGPGPTRELVPPGQIRGSNGLAVSPDAKRLYVAHSTGIAVVDIASGAVKRVDNRTRENVAAIDGLYMVQGQLIGVQNVTTPGRVIVISLAPGGERIERVQTLLSHHHNALDEPTTGAVGDGSFYLLAASGVSRFGPDGKIRDADHAPHPTVVRIPLPR